MKQPESNDRPQRMLQDHPVLRQARDMRHGTELFKLGLRDRREQSLRDDIVGGDALRASAGLAGLRRTSSSVRSLGALRYHVPARRQHGSDIATHWVGGRPS